MKKIIAFISALCVFAGISASAAQVGQSLKLGDFAESAKETQDLIDNRPDIQRRMENIDRGTVAVKTEAGVFVSWRWLGTESADVKYNIYRDGEKINSEPLNLTNYTDLDGTNDSKYSVTAVIDGTESQTSDEPVSVWSDGYFDVPLQIPQNSYVVADEELNLPYTPNDASVADLDGDGQYEIILKWDPAYVRDASKVGYTGECIIDAYEMDGTLMWRVNMGKNIRSGPHDTQFIVYDFDNDGKAEMACRTADGTVAGDGTVIGDPDADWAALDNGKNLKGPLYLTVFKGEDGSIMDTIDYEPQTLGEGWDLTDWGDGYGNRSERYLASLGCVDGVHTSFQMARGYYTGGEGPLGGRTTIVSYHVEDGKIVKDWSFDTKELENKYIGEGNHSMSTADVDYDGLDEIIYGALTVDHDGTVMYSTGLGHGDAQHVGDLLPSRPGLEVFSCHESIGAAYGYELRDARTGEILFGENTGTDNGRSCTADIDPRYEGEECWSAYGVLTSAQGEVISTSYSMPANYAIWWDGDLGREIQDGIEIGKWNIKTEETDTIMRAENCKSINAAKSNPSLTADIFGDWREETIYPLKDGSALRIFTSTEPTSYRIPTLMHDTQYRNHVALQNVCYNQPTHTSFYLGYDTKTIPVPQIYTVQDGKEIRNPDLEKGEWDISQLYSGDTQELAVNSPIAFINGMPVKIDENSDEVVAFVNSDNRTMVPLRFIAESFGAYVGYEDSTKEVTIESADDIIKMTINSDKYTVNGEEKVMDTTPVVLNDRTLVPVRAISESLSKYIEYYNGLIVISDKPINEPDNPESRIEEISNATPVSKVEYNGLYGKMEPAEITTTSESDVNLANDEDLDTVMEVAYGDTITIDLGGYPGVPALAIAFDDTQEHKANIECSNDLENWEMLIENRVCIGKDGGYNKFILGCPKYPKYMRYTCLDEEGCKIKEIAVLGVE